MVRSPSLLSIFAVLTAFGIAPVIGGGFAGGTFREDLRPGFQRKGQPDNLVTTGHALAGQTTGASRAVLTARAGIGASASFRGRLAEGPEPVGSNPVRSGPDDRRSTATDDYAAN